MIKVITGEITIDEMIEESEEFFADPMFDKSYNGVMDLRRATTRVSKLDFFKYSQYLDRSGNMEFARWAVITNSPLVVALSQIHQRISKLGSHVGVFGTVERASIFIKRPMVHKYLED